MFYCLLVIDMIFSRIIEQQILDSCFRGKAIIIYWARQVWKTTLCKKLRWEQEWTLYVTWDDYSIQSFLEAPSLLTLQDWVKWYRVLIIDEAQKLPAIWNVIKMIVDNIPDVQVIATWSSSFDLANRVQEPLTWRSKTFHLYPLSLEEILKDAPIHQHIDVLKQRLVYWMYPYNVINNNADGLFELVHAYAYKDVLNYENIKKPDLVIKLLQALALQIWSEVSYNELGQLLASDVKTIQKYIMLLEQAFIVFRLPSYARNMRNELKMWQKIYFWDLWVRNWIIRNAQPIDLRVDLWHMRENFVIAERIKYLQNHNIPYNTFFWRVTSWSEIDYIETDFWEIMDAYEIKWSDKKNPSVPASFKENYPNSTYKLIHPQNLYNRVS